MSKVNARRLSLFLENNNQYFVRIKLNSLLLIILVSPLSLSLSLSYLSVYLYFVMCLRLCITEFWSKFKNLKFNDLIDKLQWWLNIFYGEWWWAMMLHLARTLINLDDCFKMVCQNENHHHNRHKLWSSCIHY